MNVEFLKKVRTRIVNHPDRFSMDTWVCGTTACIAGHTILEKEGISPESKSFPYRDADVIQNAARSALGITVHQAEELFYAHNWPHPFGSDYVLAETDKERSGAAYRRITHFIETGE